MPDLRVQFGQGEQTAVPVGELEPLGILVLGERVEHLPRGDERGCPVLLLAQRSVQGVGYPGLPAALLGAHRHVTAPASATRTGRTRLEIGELGEIQQVAQLAQLLGAEHVRVRQVQPDQPVLHLLQRQCRLAGGQVRAERLGVLLLLGGVGRLGVGDGGLHSQRL